MIELEKVYPLWLQTWVKGAAANATSIVTTVYRASGAGFVVETGVSVSWTPQGGGLYFSTLTTLGTGDGWATTDDILVRAVVDGFPKDVLDTSKGSGAVSGVSGSGSVEYVHNVVDDSDDPIDGVAVWVTTGTDPDTGIVAGTSYTDASGNVTFMLDPGDYYFWHQHSGYNFPSDPVLETVS